MAASRCAVFSRLGLAAQGALPRCSPGWPAERQRGLSWRRARPRDRVYARREESWWPSEPGTEQVTNKCHMRE